MPGMGAPAGTRPSGGSPRMPWSVLATSSASAYERRMVTSLMGPRAFVASKSASSRWASTMRLRVSASRRIRDSTSRARSSSSALSRAPVLTRRTEPASTQRRLVDSMMARKTSRAGTWKKSRVTRCVTSSVTSMLTLYCWASRRRVVCTLASRRLRLIRSLGSRSRHAWGIASGWAGLEPAPASITSDAPMRARAFFVQDTMIRLTSLPRTGARPRDRRGDRAVAPCASRLRARAGPRSYP